MLHKGIAFPNERYRDVLEKMVKYFEALPGVFAVILTGSLARGKAVEGSCIDLSVFIEKKQLERAMKVGITHVWFRLSRR